MGVLELQRTAGRNYLEQKLLRGSNLEETAGQVGRFCEQNPGEGLA